MGNNYEVVRAEAPVERVILSLTEEDFRDIFNVYRNNFPNYYDSAKAGEYKNSDIMIILINVARELGYEL